MSTQERNALWRAWAPLNGYAPTIKGKPVHSHEMNALLDHGFTARHLATGRYVAFGDPYSGVRLDERIDFVQAHGIEVRRHPGLWSPGNTELLELWVIDAQLASDLFRTYQWAARRGSYTSSPLIVDHPVRWLYGSPSQRPAQGAAA
jgi:hypothetical protein